MKLRDDIVEVLRKLAADPTTDSPLDSRLLERIDAEADMLAAGIDMPRIRYLVARVEEVYEVKFEEQELSLFPPITLASIAGCILQKTGVLSYCITEETCASRTIRT